ncbi:Chitinase [Anopheles sinensis]|uniref:Chitinase n=1 Tax=Anopheles sinensis TaxID=74873 RepID=A0A084VSG1_ANOSI|nr:Chitinase [Anopheles sinensis]
MKINLLEQPRELLSLVVLPASLETFPSGTASQGAKPFAKQKPPKAPKKETNGDSLCSLDIEKTQTIVGSKHSIPTN